jgi:ADP-ribose pyrophosphatase
MSDKRFNGASVARRFLFRNFDGCPFVSDSHNIYQGYVDDSRNTDNAWIETSAINCHAEFQEVDHCHLKAGSDAKNVAWIEITSSLNLFASHIDLIEAVPNRHQAHW